MEEKSEGSLRNDIELLKHSLVNSYTYTEALYNRVVDLELTVLTIVDLLKLDWNTIKLIKQKCKDALLQNESSKETESLSEVSGETGEQS